jgi:hypothetical protein
MVPLLESDLLAALRLAGAEIVIAEPVRLVVRED